ncbi:hypothetical protein NEFER03_0571 [Nematocida sp. LUAm3]|nr:hypothetical protein NEFER03_0571 [Nematocida sp. LUAm3]KAI5175538.1 hypothetical protein NEFER02_1444 [Nematocida sp. LUAm2]KAI5178432.1 hypothetical protein NEFER01_1579 [Nematocida sp. LUAm1]
MYSPYIIRQQKRDNKNITTTGIFLFSLCFSIINGLLSFSIHIFDVIEQRYSKISKIYNTTQVFVLNTSTTPFTIPSTTCSPLPAASENSLSELIGIRNYSNNAFFFGGLLAYIGLYYIGRTKKIQETSKYMLFRICTGAFFTAYAASFVLAYFYGETHLDGYNLMLYGGRFLLGMAMSTHSLLFQKEIFLINRKERNRDKYIAMAGNMNTVTGSLSLAIVPLITPSIRKEKDILIPLIFLISGLFIALMYFFLWRTISSAAKQESKESAKESARVLEDPEVIVQVFDQTESTSSVKKPSKHMLRYKTGAREIRKTTKLNNIAEENILIDQANTTDNIILQPLHGSNTSMQEASSSNIQLGVIDRILNLLKTYTNTWFVVFFWPCVFYLTGVNCILFLRGHFFDGAMDGGIYIFFMFSSFIGALLSILISGFFKYQTLLLSGLGAVGVFHLLFTIVSIFITDKIVFQILLSVFMILFNLIFPSLVSNLPSLYGGEYMKPNNLMAFNAMMQLVNPLVMAGFPLLYAKLGYYTWLVFCFFMLVSIGIVYRKRNDGTSKEEENDEIEMQAI